MTRASTLRRSIRGCALLALSLLLLSGHAQAEGESIAWQPDVAKAFEQAAASKKPVMICINAQQVDGGRTEPAAKGLREIVYLDASVVAKSREFVCVLLTTAGSSADYGELRARFGLSGTFVSPQHIFAHPEHKQGDAFLAHREYWPYGKGENAVKQLLAMMDKALTAFGARERGEAPPSTEPPPPEAPEAPEAEDERRAWIDKLLDSVRRGDEETRRASLKALVEHDKEGDCIDPLLAMLDAFAKLSSKKQAAQLAVRVDIVRALGVPGLEKACPALHHLLKHKDESLRANATVTLEYIGSESSIPVLIKRMGREEVEGIANHMARALGRCAGPTRNAKARKLLLKLADGGKSAAAKYGPIIGLAYFGPPAGERFEGKVAKENAKLVRSLEKILAKFGQPFSGGRGSHTFTRAITIWTLSELRDPECAPWFRKRYIDPLDKVESRFKDDVLRFYDGVVRRIEGDDSEEVTAEIVRGMRRYLDWSRSGRELRDDARKGRDTSKFEPKAEWERLRSD